jgi:hypothetical protein
MAIKKFAVPGVVQGYPANSDLLATDIAKLTQLDANMRKKEVTEKGDEVTQTALGKACETVKDGVEQKLDKLREKLWNLCPSGTTQGDVKLHMGPLKKVSRIMQKAVHYAVCEGNSDTIQLQKVRDVLRATFEFPPSALREEGIGSRLIDTIDKEFKNKVVQVKNRFIETRYPNLRAYGGRTVTRELKEDIQYLFQNGLMGRDTFYRDLQLLVRIDNGDFANEAGLDHTILEIQLVSTALYNAKVTRIGSAKNQDSMSGHDKYKLVRAVMEHCEYKYCKERLKRDPDGIKLANAEDFYPDLSPRHWLRFTSALESMSDLYRSKQTQEDLKHLQTAIDDSAWYARVSA